MPEQVRSFALGALLSALVLVGVVRQLAIRHGVMDHPTSRSSHEVPTPRGGGLGLLLVVLGAWGWLATHPVNGAILILLAGLAMVGLVGHLDDKRGLGVGARLVVHVIAASSVGLVAAAGGPTQLIAGGLFLWWTFWTVSSINLVNFMDGINGLVVSQVIVFALSLALFPDPTRLVPLLAMIVAGACMGFLPWNFPRARIFLGDVGSGALGFLVPVLALLAMRGGDIDIVRAHLPLLPLFGDATWTIFRRWRRGERVTAPHRSHLYQRLANGGLGHTRVTVIYTLAAICGAFAAHLGPVSVGRPWLLLYVGLTVVAGILLERHAMVRARASA
jgi:UDP-N-acetylmuramyl pentapeptide phosphotransferase/UDP-N-acetylglucosamine-1-phosphate transferase